MKIIWLDSRKMTSISETHIYLKRKLRLPSYYGSNLDALWDTLSTRSEPVQINLLNQFKLSGLLGDYGERLIRVFIEAAETNHNLKFRIVNNLSFMQQALPGLTPQR
jgi:ribonuclease inhibitor